MQPRTLTATLVALLAILAIAGCGAAGEKIGTDATEDAEVRVTTTTNFITDIVGEVGGERVAIDGLLGPGVDPHLYKASAGDVTRLREADIVFFNGLYLEAKMQDVFEEISEDKPVVAVSDEMPRDQLLSPPAGAAPEEEYDPHVWFNVDLWKHAVESVRDGLIEVDPEGEATYRRNAAAYLGKLDRLDRETARKIASIPEQRRVLVTSHDAFRYLGDRYDIDVAAIQGISTAGEATTEDIERVAALIADRGVKAVFIESSVPPQTIEAVLASAAEQGQDAVVGGELFSDAAGEQGTPEGTYIGMVESNVNNLVEGLK
jgi:manganese/zinc/iron transport system substrate-binding protein